MNEWKLIPTQTHILTTCMKIDTENNIISVLHTENVMLLLGKAMEHVYIWMMTVRHGQARTHEVI